MLRDKKEEEAEKIEENMSINTGECSFLIAHVHFFKNLVPEIIISFFDPFSFIDDEILWNDEDPLAGLSSNEALKRLERYGANEIPKQVVFLVLNMNST